MATVDTASSRVFAIPELLEAILFAYGRQSQRWETCTKNSEVNGTVHIDAITYDQPLEPAISLFPVQRVSRTFAAAIRESPLLRDMMCLGGVPKSIEPRDFVLPWFLKMLDIDIKTRSWRLASTGGRLEHHKVLCPNFLIEERKPGEQQTAESRPWTLPVKWAAEQSTWRQMELFSGQERKRDPERNVDTCVEVPLQRPKKVGRLRLQSEPTLGKFYQMLESTLDRFVEYQEPEEE